ncbi:MAG: hypothetical protein KAS32_22505 [Candidatus Peribacteraceae bacterium]|nr:hypothetical protein [Candidatus Peribacteraceae bacterium]
MDKKKSTVLQAKALDSYKYGDKTYYPYGILFKNKDVGQFPSHTKEQTYFTPGIEVEYLIEKNKKEPKKSKIKPFTEEKKSTFTALGIDEYIDRKMADAVAFSASYAKDICIAHSNEKFEDAANEIYSWQLDKFKELK